MAGGVHAVDDLAEAAQRHVRLAEAGQHPVDVAHEDVRRPDHQHAAGLEAPPVGVQQVGGPVQRHDGLAGARATADRGDTAARRPNGLVLLLLDGRDDRVHARVTGSGQLRHQRAFSDHHHVVRGRIRVQEVVLEADHPRTAGAEHPPAYDTGRLGGRGLVEDGCCRRAPVDQQYVAVGVTEPDPSDVAGFTGDEVEPAEHQALVRGVQGGDALGGLEDHGVALDQPALVSQPTAAQDAVADLHALLSAAEEPGPYVLVGHSYGGPIIRLYASAHPADVAGLVLVDALSEDLPNGLTPTQQALFEEINTPPPDTDAEVLDLQGTFQQLGESPPVPQVPTIVLTADQPQLTAELLASGELPAGVDQEFADALWAAQLAAQDELAKMFPGAEHITNTNSTHYIHTEQPQLVIDSIRQVVDGARDGAETVGTVEGAE